jgi:hypothetical protein
MEVVHMGSMSPSRPFSFLSPEQLSRRAERERERSAREARTGVGHAMGVLRRAVRGFEALLLERPLAVLAVAAGIAFAAGALGGSRGLRSLAPFGLGYALGWRRRGVGATLRRLRRRSKRGL